MSWLPALGNTRRMSNVSRSSIARAYTPITPWISDRSSASLFGAGVGVTEDVDGGSRRAGGRATEVSGVVTTLGFGATGGVSTGGAGCVTMAESGRCRVAERALAGGACGGRIAGVSTRGAGLASVARVVTAPAGGAESTGAETDTLGGDDGGVAVSCVEAGEVGADGVRAGCFITTYPAMATANAAGRAQRNTPRFGAGVTAGAGSDSGPTGVAGACTTVGGNSAGRSDSLAAGVVAGEGVAGRAAAGRAGAGATFGACFGRSRVFGTGLGGVRTTSAS